MCTVTRATFNDPETKAQRSKEGVVNRRPSSVGTVLGLSGRQLLPPSPSWTRFPYWRRGQDLEFLVVGGWQTEPPLSDDVRRRKTLARVADIDLGPNPSPRLGWRCTPLGPRRSRAIGAWMPDASRRFTS